MAAASGSVADVHWDPPSQGSPAPPTPTMSQPPAVESVEGNPVMTAASAPQPPPEEIVVDLCQGVPAPPPDIRSCVADIRTVWDRQDGGLSGSDWGPVAHELLQLAVVMMQEKPKMTETQFNESRVAVDRLQDLLFEAHNDYYNSYPTETRSSDGMLQADDGRYPLFDGCWRATLGDALRGIDLEREADVLGIKYWMCGLCGRPTNDEYALHMEAKHPHAPIGRCTPLKMDEVSSPGD